MVGNQPRKHHYVPQFYLAGFTKNDSATDRLYVFDKERRTSWPSTPKGSAHQRDFYAIDGEVDGDPMTIEKKFSKLEGQWNTALQQIINSETIPDDESFGDLMMFIAFMAVRVVRFRDFQSDAVDRIHKALVHTQLSTETGRASFRKIIEEQKGPLSDEMFDKLVEFGQSDDYEVNYDQSHYVHEMLRMGIELAPALSLRNWRLWKAEDDSPDLICSRSPVAATWATAPPPGMSLFSPAFGTPNTIVSVPLNRRLALVGMLEVELPTRQLDRDGVASVNSMTSMYASQFYSSEPDFIWMMHDYSIGQIKDLWSALAREKGPLKV